MIEHRFILEPYKGMNTRYPCPSCQQKDKTYSLYIDTETGEHIHPNVGRCNRESSCGYHYTPKQYFHDNNISFDTPQPKAIKPRLVAPQPKTVSFIPVEVFKASLKANETNHFVKFLINQFGVEIASQLVSRYFIATSKHWNGATVFWQIDTQGKVRTGKIMLYNPTIGKRIKEPFNHINWVHKALKQPEFELKQCLFGEHLLIDKTKPVAIVESEKTAVIASVYLPQFIWVAVGSLTNLNVEKCSILKGRIVTLFPDLNGFEKWKSKAKELSHLTNFTVSDLLERKATEAEKEQGFDIADYLIKYNFKDFVQVKTKSIPIPSFQKLNNANLTTHQESVHHFIPTIPSENLVQGKWELDIFELKKYFEEIGIPNYPIKLNDCCTITNCSLFIESHFETIKSNNGNKTFLPFLTRLKNLKDRL
ncbi:MAG: DUF6371 domain-containing protein [Bacteroidia bacterium]|nr:DUF6371 domain-containing protein [Bacteroidia bacterium]MCF8446343.1 DUF6371 domain-containing protein [Bacteroidia bacterium]